MPTLFLIVLVDLIGFGLVIPLLPFYGVRFGATAPEVTWLLATYSLMQLFAAPLWGRLSDKIGRRPVLMASMTASAAAYLWLGAALAFIREEQRRRTSSAPNITPPPPERKVLPKHRLRRIEQFPQLLNRYLFLKAPALSLEARTIVLSITV
jgi:MFS family permease